MTFYDQGFLLMHIITIIYINAYDGFTLWIIFFSRLLLERGSVKLSFYMAEFGKSKNYGFFTPPPACNVLKEKFCYWKSYLSFFFFL